ncbi:AEC family transporter [Shewanella violacea]|uniref:Auxin efflux carrier family protein n=1 Tax=Shewanella violacea (strain JCM 10179 / CIP 106290 / LMG 19151 / DSS12) TaxID=637905 RepID=D4ZM00_SHEVD|nr:AEC family transporter [Shewanella violacea]BAJ02699.1 auxin efflux carrier family protein [Shewanella violacea DSS12]
MFIVSIIFPLIFMVGLGYLLTHIKYLSREHIAGIGKFAFNISIPAFLFLNMYKAPLEQSLNITELMAFYLPVLAVYGIGFLACKLFRRGNDKVQAHSAVYALGCSYSNTILVGLPIIIGALGESMMGNVFVIITFHSALLFALTFLIASKGAGQGFSWPSFTRSILFNPVVMSISMGILINALGFNLPDELMSGLSLLAQPALACALFVLGANLSFYSISQDWKFSALACVIKLLVLPALVYFFGHYGLGMVGDSLALVVLLSASPLGVNAYLIATQLKVQQSVLASTVVLSTVLSVFSFGFWLWFLL